MNHRLEWYPWYWKDWRLSQMRVALDAEHRGVYRELLDECFAEGSFPLDFQLLGRLCALPAERIEAIWPAIRHKFEQRPDGRWNSPNMSRVFNEQKMKHDARVQGGRKGGRGKVKGS